MNAVQGLVIEYEKKIAQLIDVMNSCLENHHISIDELRKLLENHQICINELRKLLENTNIMIEEKIDWFSMTAMGNGMINLNKLDEFDIQKYDVIQERYGFKAKGYVILISKKCLEIDPYSKYTLSAEIKVLNELGVQFYNFIGFYTYTDPNPNSKPIYSENIFHVSNTFTKLIRMEDDNKTLFVTNSQKWDKNGVGSPDHEYIAFGAKEDSSDLPNRNLKKIKIVSVDHNKNTIKLEQPLIIPKDFESDQELFIRKHTAGNDHNYLCYKTNPNTNDFIEYSGTIQDYHDGTTNEMHKWRPGAKYARIMFFISHGNKHDPSACETIIRNIKLRRE